MRLSIISDEISHDLTIAAELAADWGIKHLELRRCGETRAPRGMSDADIRGALDVARRFGLDIPSVSPGLFKVRLGDSAIEEHRGDLRARCLEMAELLGAQVMVVFPYVRAAEDEPDDEWPAEMVSDFQETARLAAERGVVVAIENEAVCYAATGTSMARFLDEVGHPNCGANWDPANEFAYHGQDFRAGYEALGERIVHVHIKDYALDAEGRRTTVPPGEGGVDWPGQVRALIADGYEGLAVIETHFAPKVAGSRACAEAMGCMLDEVGEAIA